METFLSSSPQTKKCLTCSRTFTRPKRKSLNDWLRQKYCCFLCSTRRPAWNKGKKDYLSDEARQKMANNARANLAKETPEQKENRTKKAIVERKKIGYEKFGEFARNRRGEKHHNWLGEEAGYSSKHKWILKHWGKTGICDFCKQTKKTEWANKDYKYMRIRENWFELCVKCHRNYDKHPKIRH